MTPKMSAAGGTFRGTPKGRPQASTNYSESSPSNIPIPRPKLDSQPSETASTFSASRAKQTRRDEVRMALYQHGRSNR